MKHTKQTLGRLGALLLSLALVLSVFAGCSSGSVSYALVAAFLEEES